MARTRPAASPMERPDPRFEGSAYSNEELEFLLDHFGEPAIVALPPDEELPTGVNEHAVGPILQRTYDLELYQQSLRDKAGTDELRVWCGFDKLRDVCRKTLSWNAQVAELKRRTKGSAETLRFAAAVPSLHVWDPSTDTASFGAIGSDAGRVLTMLNEHGQREELYVDLRTIGEGSIRTLAGIASFVKAKSDAEMQGAMMADTPDELVYDAGSVMGTVTCPVCLKSESFEVEKPNTKKAATKRVMDHLKSERHVKVDQHRLLYRRLISGRAGARTNRIPAGSQA